MAGTQSQPNPLLPYPTPSHGVWRHAHAALHAALSESLPGLPIPSLSAHRSHQCHSLTLDTGDMVLTWLAAFMWLTHYWGQGTENQGEQQSVIRDRGSRERTGTPPPEERGWGGFPEESHLDFHRITGFSKGSGLSSSKTWQAERLS